MGDMEVQADAVLDGRGLLCPMPIVKLAKLMKTLTPGQVVKLITTDKGSLADVPAWAGTTGNELVATHDGGTEFTFVLRKV